MFKHRQCLYWFEFAPILKRAQRSGTSLRIFPPNHLNIVTILDGERPLKKGLISTGYSDDDWARDSLVVNSSWHDGCIPMRSVQGKVEKDEDWNDVMTPFVRGVQDTLAILLAEDCINMTYEVEELMW